MSCERYWRDGVLAVERGLPDPHLAMCGDCRSAHAERDELIRALPVVGPLGTGRSDWQARVWAEIARGRRPEPSRRGWIVGALAAACAIAIVLVWLGVRTADPPRSAPYVTAVRIEKGTRINRGEAQVGDIVRTLLDPDDEVRIYRGDELVFRCPPATTSRSCVRSTRGADASYPLATAGEYSIVIITRGTVEPTGSLDRDLAALVRADVKHRIDRELSVR